MSSYFFIDGFNIYHAIKKSFTHEKYKWLDLRKFCEQFIDKDDVIKEVLFFTAYTIWDQRKVERHKTYIQALSHSKVTVIMGRFKRVSRNFSKQMEIVFPEGYVFNGPDRIQFTTYEEKETDVNIAVRMLEYAMDQRKGCEKVYVVSADSDLIPAVKALKRNAPNIKIINVLPVNCIPSDLANNCHEVIETREAHFESVLLPDKIKISENVTLKKPQAWN